MTFRRDGADSHRWQQWIAKNRDSLLRCGIPMSLVRSERDWAYFIGHGDHPEFTFDVTYLSRSQSEALLAMLRSEYGEDGGAARVVIKELERWLNLHQSKLLKEPD